MRFLSVLLVGLCACMVCVVMGGGGRCVCSECGV